ncbi:hypothetical protein FIU90_00410 [Erythrobacter sp. THAF29]|nr:hypothetical protein FIU90_00410 [Erythrobacter sp. THAF29]
MVTSAFVPFARTVSYADASGIFIFVAVGESTVMGRKRPAHAQLEMA